MTIDQPLHDPQIGMDIRSAAFDAAYLELPDPASAHFVTLVARHEKRLWDEIRGRGSEERRVAGAPGQRPARVPVRRDRRLPSVMQWRPASASRHV